MASDGRKSLMITKEAHAHIMQLADTFEVSQPEIVEALLKNVDRARLQSALSEMLAAKKREEEDKKRKDSLLKTALATMSADELEAILKNRR